MGSQHGDCYLGSSSFFCFLILRKGTRIHRSLAAVAFPFDVITFFCETRATANCFKFHIGMMRKIMGRPGVIFPRSYSWWGISMKTACEVQGESSLQVAAVSNQWTVCAPGTQSDWGKDSRRLHPGNTDFAAQWVFKAGS